jgi:5,10-methylenetetrahydrofolate reductase
LGFLRVVEVFPPFFRRTREQDGVDLNSRIESFVEDVRRIRSYADVVLVASLKDPGLVTVSTTAAASLITENVGVEGAPVIVARDSNRREMGSTILGAYSLGLKTLMLAWGDRGHRGDPMNVYDYRSLSEVIIQAKAISAASKTRCRLLAPVDLARLGRADGVRVARSRLEAGADLLLAQPPTTDSSDAMDRHLAVLEASGLRNRVLLCAFPFRDANDVIQTEKYFGWKLPPSFKRKAASNVFDPIGEARLLVRRLRKDGLPGVYLSTRGTPLVAREVLR